MKRKILALGIMLGLVGATGVLSAAATSADVDMKIAPAAVEFFTPGGSATFQALLTTRVDACQSWSFGILLEPDAGVTAKVTSVANGAGTMTAKAGDPADYKKLNYYQAANLAVPVTCSPAPCFPPDVVGFIQAVIIDNVDSIVTLPASTDFDMVQFAVDVQGGDGQTCAVSFTETLNNPPTQCVTAYGGQGVPPGVLSGATITLKQPTCAPPAAFTIEIGDAKGGTNAEVASLITLNFNTDGSWPAETQIQGWSYGICVLDPTKLGVVSGGATVAGTDSATVYLGGPPGYNKINYFENGIVHAVIIDNVDSIVTIPTQNDWTDLVAKFKILMGAGDPAVYVTPCNEKLGGTKKTANVMVIAGNSIKASTFEGTDPLDPGTGCCDPAVCNKPGKFEFLPAYSVIPGSANGDGRLDIADGVYILNWLFRDGPDLPCEVAGDADGSCVVDTADALRIIYYYFQPPAICPAGGCPAPAGGLGCQLVSPDACPLLTCEHPVETGC
jgi:hypothetical protein